MSNSSDSNAGPTWSNFGTSACLAKDDPNRVWPYCPNETAAVLFTVLFFITTVANIVLAIKHRMGFCTVLIMGALWELFGYAVRIVGTQYNGLPLYVVQTLFIFLAPLWINAFVYMLFARVVHYFDPAQKVGPVRATRLGVWLITLDIGTFLVQFYGVVQMTGTDINAANNGKNIYMGGIGFQQFLILIFSGLVTRFWQRVRRNSTPRSTSFMPTVILIYLTLLFISVRIIFRMIEYSQGFDSPIPDTESYQYIFDAVPMLAATVVWIALHPGRVLVEKDGFFPTRKQKKAQKQARKALKAAEKAENKQGGMGKRLLGSTDKNAYEKLTPSPSGSPYLLPTRPPHEPSSNSYYGAGLEEQGMLGASYVPYDRPTAYRP